MSNKAMVQDRHQLFQMPPHLPMGFALLLHLRYLKSKINFKKYVRCFTEPAVLQGSECVF